MKPRVFISLMICLSIFLIVLPVSATTYTLQYPPAHTSTYVKATTESSNQYAYFATDPLKSLTGTHVNNQWFSTGYVPQRFHIDLGSAKIIRRIYYENGHTDTTWGAKTFSFWGSNTAGSFAELTYGTDTGWTQLSTSQGTFDEHAAPDAADPKYITVTNTVSYRYYALKISDGYGSSYLTLRRIVMQTEDGYAPPDTSPPDSIASLTNSTGCDSVTWSWTNPTNSDYFRLQTYRNNTFLEYLNNATTTRLWSGLPEATSMTISTKTEDLIGNVNATWVNGTMVTDLCAGPTPTPTPTPTVTATSNVTAAAAVEVRTVTTKPERSIIPWWSNDKAPVYLLLIIIGLLVLTRRK